MKNNAFKRLFSLLAVILLLTAAFPAALADGGSLYVTGYRVTDANGYPLGSVTKGTTVNITVSLKDVGADPGDPASLDIVKLDDSFTGGWQSVAQTSARRSGSLKIQSLNAWQIASCFCWAMVVSFWLRTRVPSAWVS